MHTVFVYGTLKQGHGNNRLLQDAIFCGSGYTYENKYGMVSHGCPSVHFMPDGEPGHHIGGEIYLVNDIEFASLDRLEGYPRLYDRCQVWCTIGGFEDSPETDYTLAWMYMINDVWPGREQDYSVSYGGWTPRSDIEEIGGVLHWGLREKDELADLMKHYG